MNYLRRKYMALMRGVNFRGYLRKASGYPLTLTDCMDSDIVSLSVAGNAVQDGTPSPDAPVEVVGVGDKTEPYVYRVPIECRGRNLFDGIFEQGHVLDSSVISPNRIKSKQIFPVKAGETYAISSDCDGFDFVLGNYRSYPYANYVTGTGWASGSAVLKCNGDGYLTIMVRKQGDKVIKPEDVSAYKFMLTKTDMATPYEPYYHDTVNIYTDKPLYGVDGVPYEEKVLTGNESWSKYTELTDTYAFVSGLGYSDWTYDKAYSNYFPRNSSVGYDKEGFASGDNSSRVYFRINKDRLNSEFTLDAWKAWLKEKYDSENPVKVYFKKQTETQPQLNGQLHLHKGTNILTSTATVEPTGMTAEYYSSKEV